MVNNENFQQSTQNFQHKNFKQAGERLKFFGRKRVLGLKTILSAKMSLGRRKSQRGFLLFVVK